MLIDIHRHAADKGAADVLVRNLFHNQFREINQKNWYTIGLHPWHVSRENIMKDAEMVREAAMQSRILAIGEAGLDKSISTPYDVQKEAFRVQTAIAGEVDKPMIIHCVRAYNDIMEARQEHKSNQPWIIHWFNASLQIGEQLISKGFYLSFGHMLFNMESKAFKAFPQLPENRIFFETDDADYNIRQIYDRAAELRKVNVYALEESIRKNFIRCFGIEP